MAWVATYAGSVESRTVKRYIAALCSHHIDLGLPVDSFVDLTVDRVVRGIQRFYGNKASKRALPITLPILERMVRHYLRTKITRKSATFIAAFTLMFACFLRLGEITYDVFDPAFHPQRCDVLLDTDPPTFTVKASKTDEYRESTVVPIPKGLPYSCARRALALYFQTVPGRPSDPLFSSGKGFDRAAVTSELRRVLDSVGIVAVGYTGHSF